MKKTIIIFFSSVGRDIKLKAAIGGTLVRTFCVCSGGDSVVLQRHGGKYYDGHFSDEITNTTNFGVLARSRLYNGETIADDYIRSMQPFFNAEISLKDFLKYYSLFSRNTQYEPLFNALSEFLKILIESGIISQNPSSIPVMLPSVDKFNSEIVTDCNFQTNVENLFVIGDAAGVSRGYVQAMWSGYCAAERIAIDNLSVEPCIVSQVG